MWAGDVQSGYPTQWALNPSTYQNLPNEQVDWASLAQQWIKMKETFPEPQAQVPPAPPPPSIQADIEAGEAPMDVTKDEATHTPTSSSATSQDGNSWGNWGGEWQQWGWGWGGPPDSYTAPAVAPPAATFDYNHGASMPDNFEQGQQGYWSEGPAPFVRNKSASADWRPERAPSRRHSGKVEEVPEPDTTTLFDAAKRKQLPAWIREGLEKMEREKQKKLEREKQLKEREEEMLRRKQEEEEALASGVQLKSKFDTDSEESEKEAEPEAVMKPRRSRFDTASSPVLPKPTVPNSYSPPPVKRKSREEIMQDVMQQVRYVLTDILMTVTNEEMRKIAEEVLADFRAKAPASRLRQTPALTSLTGKLGLGIYDSDSEDSSAESDDERPSRQNGVDSDEELRERIGRKKQEFARIERDIEHQVEQEEERDRERQMEEEEEEEEEKQERWKEMGQVEPKLLHPGNRVDIKAEEPKINPELKYEQTKLQSFTPERSQKEKESSVDRSEDSNSSSKSESSSSRSSSSSRHKKSRKSSKRKKEKKSSKKKRKRSHSRSSDRRKSHKKTSHSHRYERERSRSRSRSRSRGHHDDYHRYRRHSSESSHKRRHHSYSGSPDHSRGKRSSHRSRD